MKRKIAIIADGWRRHITYVWIRGCRNYIKEHELDIEISVFHSFGNFSRDEKFNAGEYNIIHLPDLSQFDGIILEVTNMLNQKKRQQIIRIIQESGVPAVSLLEKIPGLYHAGLDNYATMEQMVEHLIVAHSCKTLNYVGGPADSQENLLRRQAYEDVLQRYGIPLENDRIWNESYEVESGVRAFIHFQEKHLLPDAFVCANENIAVGLCHQAQQEGFKIPADFCVTGFDNFDKLREFYEYLELPSLLRELNKLKPQAEVYNMSYRVIDNPIDISDALDDNSSLIFESSEYNYHRANLLYIGLKNKKGNFIILPDLLYQSIDLQLFMADKENHKSIYDYKRAYVLLKKMGFELNGVDFDMLLGAYVLNPSITKNEFKMVASSFNYYKLRFDEEVYGKGVKRSIPEPSLLMEHVISKVECLYLIKNQIISSLKENDQYDLLTQIEIPLSRVLGKMEFEGIKVDLNELNLQKKDLEERINFIESEIFRLAGETFNISSPKQLGVVLFEHLGLPSSKKTKTGYSTDQSALEEVKHLHPVVEYILNYRMLTKLYQTYIIGLNEQIFADEKCHTIYEQALTQTGRLSSIEPNLQNIPIRTEQGRLIRKMFIPSNKNNCFFSADYSQIELRVLAHLANVKKMLYIAITLKK